MGQDLREILKFYLMMNVEIITFNMRIRRTVNSQVVVKLIEDEFSKIIEYV